MWRSPERGELGEEALDEIEPGAVLGREGKFEAADLGIEFLSSKIGALVILLLCSQISRQPRRQRKRARLFPQSDRARHHPRGLARRRTRSTEEGAGSSVGHAGVQRRRWCWHSAVSSLGGFQTPDVLIYKMYVAGVDGCQRLRSPARLV